MEGIHPDHDFETRHGFTRIDRLSIMRRFIAQNGGFPDETQLGSLAACCDVSFEAAAKLLKEVQAGRAKEVSRRTVTKEAGTVLKKVVITTRTHDPRSQQIGSAAASEIDIDTAIATVTHHAMTLSYGLDNAQQQKQHPASSY